MNASMLTTAVFELVQQFYVYHATEIGNVANRVARCFLQKYRLFCQQCQIYSKPCRNS